MTRSCENCGREFTARRSDARHCNSSCRAEASRARKQPVRPVVVYAHCRCGQHLRVAALDATTHATPQACPACGAAPPLEALSEASVFAARPHRSMLRRAA